jgi:hypothetical protein
VVALGWLVAGVGVGTAVGVLAGFGLAEVVGAVVGVAAGVVVPVDGLVAVAPVDATPE